MKFPGGGGIFSRDFLVGESGSSRGPPASQTEDGLEVETKPRRPKIKRCAQLELFGDGLVTAHVRGLEIIQQAAALADHHQESAAGAVIFLVALQMLGQVVDALGEQRDLHVGGPGVLGVHLKCFNRLGLRFHKLYEG